MYCRGEGSASKSAFRRWYGRLSELRSLLPEARLLVMTATAGPSLRHRIRQRLGLTSSNLKEIIESPNRENIKLSIMEYKSTQNMCDLFDSIIDKIVTEQDKCDRIIIFCRRISDCGYLYAMFVSNVSTTVMSHINMYHSKTCSDVKTFIQDDMSRECGHIRILICSSAAGMGINFAAVKFVIHFGPPYTVDDLLQQFGRAGRDGAQSYHLMLHCPRQRRGLQEEMVTYLKSDKCYRQQLMSFYGDPHEPNKLRGHFCCDLCSLTCTCKTMECYVNRYHPIFEQQQIASRLSITDAEVSTAYRRRTVSDSVEIDLHISVSELIENHICAGDYDECEPHDVLNSIICNISIMFSKCDVENLCMLCCSEVLHTLCNTLSSYFDDFEV